MSGSAGQLCTKPGFFFIPVGHNMANRFQELANGVAEHRLLYPAIATGYRDRRDAILDTRNVKIIAEGSLRLDDDRQGWATPTIVSVSIATLQEQRVSLLDEAFGPLSIVVEYDDEARLADIAAELFDGNLTGTVHTAPGEVTPAVRQLVALISARAGRVIFNGWPTGVAVTPAMQHGGPWSVVRGPRPRTTHPPLSEPRRLTGSFARLRIRTHRLSCCQSHCAMTSLGYCPTSQSCWPVAGMGFSHAG